MTWCSIRAEKQLESRLFRLNSSGDEVQIQIRAKIVLSLELNAASLLVGEPSIRLHQAPHAEYAYAGWGWKNFFAVLISEIISENENSSTTDGALAQQAR